jgi:5'' nucleotidase, deoxy (Pyrimidine), cytosolic type C protein (NT5C).
MRFHLCRKIEKPKLGLDLDDTLADTNAALKELLRERYNKSEITECDVRALSKGEIIELAAECWKTPEKIFPVDKNFKYTFSSLHEIYEIHIVTLNRRTPREVIEYWLKKNNVPYDRLHITKDCEEKTRYVDVLVDDSLKCVEAQANAGKQAILIARPNNENFIATERIVRLKTWREISNYLEIYYAFLLSKRK